jgi:hypothetical protein
MLADPKSSCEFVVEPAITDQHVASTFNQQSQKVEATCPMSEHSMEANEHKPSAERRKERGRAVHGGPA